MKVSFAKGMIITLVLVLIVTAMLLLGWSNEINHESSIINIKEDKMKIESDAFASNSNIPSEYTCDGGNINPPLRFSGVPDGAKTLVLIMDDPDAPNGVWVHWLVWNMNVKTAGIAKNSIPPTGVQGQNTRGMNSYGGPCPPNGVHHYYFKLFALNKSLNLPAATDKKALEQAMEGAIIERASLIGLYPAIQPK